MCRGCLLSLACGLPLQSKPATSSLFLTQPGQTSKRWLTQCSGPKPNPHRSSDHPQSKQALVATLISTQWCALPCKHAPGLTSSPFELNCPPPQMFAVRRRTAAARAQDTRGVLQQEDIWEVLIRPSTRTRHRGSSEDYRTGTGDISVDTSSLPANSLGIRKLLRTFKDSHLEERGPQN